ncbi:MAG: LytTR family transcriptional regulator [Chitinophagaceae bacterium]|nr:LytTR family transcriptional regulator [Chitinophagaceae bacterium]
MKILSLKVAKVNLRHLQQIIAQNIPESLIIESHVFNDYLESQITEPPTYKTRFLIKLGDTIKSLDISNIAYFYAEHKTNFVCSIDGKHLPIDHTLDQLEKRLHPKKFFRINRQFIIGHHAIDEMKAHTRSRIIVKLSPTGKTPAIVAIDRANDFKKWLSE